MNLIQWWAENAWSFFPRESWCHKKRACSSWSSISSARRLIKKDLAGSCPNLDSKQCLLQQHEIAGHDAFQMIRGWYVDEGGPLLRLKVSPFSSTEGNPKDSYATTNRTDATPNATLLFLPILFHLYIYKDALFW
jgi:hypothetical protein